MITVIYALVTMKRPRRPFTLERMLLFDQFAKSFPRLAFLYLAFLSNVPLLSIF